MKNKFKSGTAIVFEPKWAKDKKVDKRHPLKYGEVVYYLTDIPNVIGHCIVVKYNGKTIPMIHPEDCRVAKEEEL
jgi:hypothetical protein